MIRIANLSALLAQLLARATYEPEMTREVTVKGIELAGKRQLSERWSILDLRLASRARRKLEFSLCGKNLLHSRHVESLSNFLPQTTLPVEHAYFVQARIGY